MVDFLIRRNGTWHFVRRVPIEFSAVDQRGVAIRHSTKVRVAGDRTGRRATRVAEKLNSELGALWRRGGQLQDAATAYDDARRRARSLAGLRVYGVQPSLWLALGKLVDRLEAASRKLENDSGARAALHGTRPRPSFAVSKLFEEYEAATKDETKAFSRNQLRVWRGGRIRFVRELVEIVGDKPVTELTQDDGIDYSEWWRERVVAEEAVAKSANKSISMISRMLKEMSIRRQLNLPDIFKGLRLKTGADKSRSPYEQGFIQNTMLAEGALKGLNEDARLVIYLLADTGLRLSEALNLQANSIPP